MSKKILILPAINDHVDLILEAKRNGYFVLTCDNDPNNIAHAYSDLSYNISLLDYKGILQLSEFENIDAITTFSNDFGAQASSYVSNKMKLNGNPKSVVDIMTNKGLFRSFLEQNNFNSPSFCIVDRLANISLSQLSFPVIVKPVDRAGSKGVSVANCGEELVVAFENAMDVSIQGKVIVEKYISSKYFQIHGDAIVQNGIVVFCYLGDQYFGVGKFKNTPVGTVFPSGIDLLKLKKVKSEVQRFIDAVGFVEGGLNIEVRIDGNDSIYLIEVAPRFGGNYIPKAISYACSIDITKYAFDIAIGKKITILPIVKESCVMQFILRSHKTGFFRSISINNSHDFEVLESYCFKKEGVVLTAVTPDNIVAVLILKIINKEIITRLLNNTNSFFKINLQSDK